MRLIRRKQNKHFHNALKTKKRNAKCRYPQCDEKAINSHILQKSGILSILEEERHLMQPEIELFGSRTSKFVRKGINDAFSFPCFCEKHDDEIFKPIEQKELDLAPYSNRLLFLIRSKLNEQYRKEVVYQSRLNIRMDKDLERMHELQLDNTKALEQTKLAIEDIRRDLEDIWLDYTTGKESFRIEVRSKTFIPICLAAFIDYETSEEINFRESIIGNPLDKLTSLHISIFPHNEGSTLLMAHKLTDRNEVHDYVNQLLDMSNQEFEVQVTNWILFYIETWVTSESFYKSDIKDVEYIFEKAAQIQNHLGNEREVHELNLFHNGFEGNFNAWTNRLRF
jgi:hypothetical protein